MRSGDLDKYSHSSLRCPLSDLSRLESTSSESRIPDDESQERASLAHKLTSQTRERGLALKGHRTIKAQAVSKATNTYLDFPSDSEGSFGSRVGTEGKGSAALGFGTDVRRISVTDSPKNNRLQQV